MTTTDRPASAGGAPTADWVDMGELARDPYDTYRRLRELGPIVWVPVLNRYLCLSYSGCRALEADQETFTATASALASTRALGGPAMLGKDDPEHAVERAPINRAMRPKNVREFWAPLFERNARTGLDELVAVGPEEADLNRDFAGPLSARNLTDMVGLKGARPVDMVRWSHAFTSEQANIQEVPAIRADAEAARREVDELLDELMPYYRQNPDSSLASAWANSGIPLEDVYANVKLTIAGGLNEPKHMVSTMVWALTDHPDQLELLAAEPGRWAEAFDEGVRWVSPIAILPRIVTRPATLEGVTLPVGALVCPVLAAGNHDPDVFERPDEFDLARPRVSHLGFGSGVHQCAGHWAARIGIGEIAVPMLYGELPGLRIDRRRPASWSGWVFRGVENAPVTWDAA
jgi:cytochrome P450